MTSQTDKISVIVSLQNDGDNVSGLYQGLTGMLGALKSAYEIIFVDDGSRDNTREELDKLAVSDASVRIVRMRDTFGEAAALDAGLRYSDGQVIFYLSGRVRICPEAFRQLFKVLKEGQDLVVGWRYPRRDALLNRWISRIFNSMAGFVTKVKLHDINSGMFVTYRGVLEKIAFYGDLYNFIPALAAQQGYKVTEEKVEQMTGAFRTSRYPTEYLQRFLDIITVYFLTRFSKKPIHLMGFLGGLLFIIGFFIEAYLGVYRILGMGPIAGRPLLILGALLLVIGIQMVTIGLLGEMIIFTHAGEIEEYNIEEIINE